MSAAPQNLNISVNQPQIPPSQEPSAHAPIKDPSPDDVMNKWGRKLVDLITRKRNEWEWKRRGIVIKVLKNKEMLKGNQNLGFLPGSYDSFDAMEEFRNWSGSGADDKNADRSMDKRPHNFYQMLEKAYVAALGSQIPKTRWSPANADDEEDRETAKVASRVEEIIERANDPEMLLWQELMELFTSGCYFKYTRFVVDPDRTGTHKETTLEIMKADVLPPRFQCFQCGTVTNEDAMAATQKSMACPVCGTPFGPENYFESHVDEMPVAKQKTDVPNGMVLQDVFGPIHVDADPSAPDLNNTCLLNLAQEVSLGWLRTTFKKRWAEFQNSQSSGSAQEEQERLYRDMLTTPTGYASWWGYGSQSKPTYNRTWCQPMLFAEMDDQKAADELMQAFPKGCMIAWVGMLPPLVMRPEKLTDMWTWCGTESRGFGLYPPPAGDPAVPVQERINDCISKIDEYMDRLALGILLANSEYIDTEAMNNKAMLPGLLNPVYVKKGKPLTDITTMIYQVKAEIDAQIFNYVTMLKQDMELLVGTPPQLFGAGTQDGVETATGQAQQQQTGMMKLGLHWGIIRREHANSAENSIKCAAENMTEDWQQTVADESEEFKNEYVHLDQMKGSVHAEPDTEQGFPMTSDEIRAWWQDLFKAGDNILAQMLMQEPENIDQAIRFAGVPGLVAPQGAMRGKMLRIISKLIAGKPIEVPDPQNPQGPPLQLPSLAPNKYLDDLSTLEKLIPRWAQTHWDQLESNQSGLDNLVSYYRQCIVLQKELQSEMQLTGDAAQQSTEPQGAQA